MMKRIIPILLLLLLIASMALHFWEIRKIRNFSEIFAVQAAIEAPREIDKKLAKRVIKGEKFHPATKSLWFYNSFDEDCKAKWWGQWNSGRYKSHCFYSPVESENCY